MNKYWLLGWNPLGSVNKLPFGQALQLLGQYFTHFWGPGRACERSPSIAVAIETVEHVYNMSAELPQILGSDVHWSSFYTWYFFGPSNLVNFWVGYGFCLRIYGLEPPGDLHWRVQAKSLAVLAGATLECSAVSRRLDQTFT